MTEPARPLPLATGPTFPRLSRVAVQDEWSGPHGAAGFVQRAAYAVAEALFTTEQGAPPRARLDWVVSELDDFLRHAGARARLIFVTCLLVITWLSPLWIGRFRPLFRLSRAERVRALTRFERGALGLTVLGCKALLCILYYEHPDAAREIRFDGECLTPAAPL